MLAGSGASADAPNDDGAVALTDTTVAKANRNLNVVAATSVPEKDRKQASVQPRVPD
jgi:hypothetical protein